MRHHKITNFRGIESYADATNLDRGSLEASAGALSLPRGTLSSGVLWKPASAFPNYAQAFEDPLAYVDGATIDCSLTEYLRSRVGFPHTQFYVMSNKGALFMAGDPTEPQRVWIAEPANKRESIISGLDSSVLSYVDILNMGHYPEDPVIRALSVYGPYIYVHHNYGITALYDVDVAQDPVTGFRVPQNSTAAPSSAANYRCADGDVFVGYDAQIYQDMREIGPPHKQESREKGAVGYKATGGFEHLLATGWQSTAMGVWLPTEGLYLLFAKLAETSNYGYFVFHRPTLTLTGPFKLKSGLQDVGNVQESGVVVLKFLDGETTTYYAADFGELHERRLPDIAEVAFADSSSTSLVPLVATGTSIQKSISDIVLNWDDLGDPNVHKSFEEVQLNFAQGSVGRVAVMVENERGQTSGSLSRWYNLYTGLLEKDYVYLAPDGLWPPTKMFIEGYGPGALSSVLNVDEGSGVVGDVSKFSVGQQLLVWNKELFYDYWLANYPGNPEYLRALPMVATITDKSADPVGGTLSISHDQLAPDTLIYNTAVDEFGGWSGGVATNVIYVGGFVMSFISTNAGLFGAASDDIIFTTGKRYRIRLEYFCPSTNVGTVTSITVNYYDSIGDEVGTEIGQIDNPAEDVWLSYEASVVADGDGLLIRYNALPVDDTLNIRNITIYEEVAPTPATGWECYVLPVRNKPERIKAFTNLNGRAFRVHVRVESLHDFSWILRDISLGFTPGVEL